MLDSNNKFRLQILNHEDIFPTREDALEYISDFLKPNVLMAEPAVAFYGEASAPKVILALGSGDRKVFTIDVAKLEEDVAKMSENEKENTQDIQNALKSVKSLIDACGLKYDTNKIENQITYEPDAKDKLIGDVKSLAQAIDVLSKYVQEVQSNSVLNIADTKSVKLVYKEDAENGGKVLKAKVNISDNGDSDDEGFNNNIIGIKSDGLYAAAHLEYNEDTNELTFYSSGMKNGKFQDDAKKKTFKLGKHLEIKAENSDENPVKVNVETKDNVSKISTKVALSERNNILKITDGKLTAWVEMSYNESNNQISFNNGVETKTFTLNSGSVVERTYYDASTESIVIVFKLTNGSTSDVKIPVRDILNEWGVENTGKSVTLTKTVDSGSGKDLLSADVNVSTKDDNILVNDNGYLYVKGVSSNIRYKEITVAKALDLLEKADVKLAEDLLKEVNDRTNAIEKVVNQVEKEIEDRKHADEDIKHLIDDLDISGLKTTLDQFKETYYEFEKEWSAYKVQIEKAIADAEAVVGRVTEIEKKLVEHETNLNNLTERVNKAEDNINNNTAKIADNTLAITNEATLARQNESELRTALEKEITRSVAKDEELEGLIKNGQSDIETIKNKTNSLENSVTSLQETDVRLEGLINSNKNAIDENKNSIGTLSTSVAGLRNELENEVTRATGEEKRIEEKLDNLASSSKAASDNALEQAKNYTDAEILKATATASEDASTKANKALEDAKSYSDEKLALETARAQEKEQANADSITELKAKDAEIEANVAKKVESVTIEKNSQSDLQYTLYVDGSPAGEINIPKDQFLKDVRYDVGTKSLVFTWAIDDDSQKVTSVDVSDFLSTYYAGNGLKMVDNIFSVKLTTANESYLQVNEDGIQLVGIDAKFDTKADKSDTYTKLEVDNLVEAEAIRAKSVENGLQNAIDTTNSNLSNLTDRVAETENRLNIVQGNSAQEGSVENAIYQSKVYTDEKITEVNTEIAKKANVDDVYSKTDIDNKGYLVNSDIEHLASKSEVETETERAKAAEEKNETAINTVKETADNNALEIVQLKKDVATLEPFVEETNTVKMHANKSATGTTYSSDVKLDLEKANIIQMSGNGLYAEVSLTYNTAENKLVFTAGGVEREFQLSGASTLQDAYYNSANRQLVFIVSLQNGETKQVTVDVNDLINTLRIDNLANSPVQLTLTQDPQGNDLLSANLIISTKEDNAVLSDNGTLYVSKRAANLTALWGDDADKNLQVVLNEIKTRTDSIDEIKSDVGQLKTDVNDLTKQVNENTLNITNINNTLNEYNTRLEKVEGSVTNIEQSLTTLQETITNIQNEIGGSGEGEMSIKERLEALEAICNNLIDFGTYNV